jgi:hypothetical protein
MRSGAYALSNKHNPALYLDRELVAKSKELGFNLSKTFENHLHLITQFSTSNPVNNAESTVKNAGWWAGPDLNRRPLARKANVLTKLDDRPIFNRCLLTQTPVRCKLVLLGININRLRLIMETKPRKNALSPI